MRGMRYLLFTLIILFSCMFCVHAACTDTELEVLKKQAEDIKITYKHLGAIEDNSMVVYDRFDVTFKNIPADTSLILSYAPSDFVIPEDGVVKLEMMVTGTYDVKVFSDKCEDSIYEIEFTLPTFNEYSLDPLCEGIDGKDFPLCGKYYEYKVDYDNFVARVKHYRSNYHITNGGTNSNSKSNILNVIGKFLSKYLNYVVVSFVVLLLVIVLIVMIRKRKKRGVLE